MLILTQDRKRLINIDNLVEIYRYEYDSKISYNVFDSAGNEMRIAEYNNTPEHKNQIERIAEVYGAINCYVMPKEEI